MIREHHTNKSSHETPCSTKEKCIAFIHKHKAPIIIASLTITSLALGTYFAKSSRHNSIEVSVVDSTTNVIPMKNNTNIPSPICYENTLPELSSPHFIQVREHIRNLPINRKPSLLKIKWAEQHGYSLGTNQTIVNAHIKTVA